MITTASARLTLTYFDIRLFADLLDRGRPQGEIHSARGCPPRLRKGREARAGANSSAAAADDLEAKLAAGVSAENVKVVHHRQSRLFEDVWQEIPQGFCADSGVDLMSQQRKAN
jgi:hypothetical protein